MAKAKPAAEKKEKKSKSSKGGGFDAMAFLMAHGERMFIGVAGTLTVLLVLTSLFLPGTGFFAEDPKGKADTLTKEAESVTAQVNNPNAVVPDSDKPAPDSDKKLVALNVTALDPADHKMAALVPAGDGGSLGRRRPTIYGIEEAAGKLARMQIQTYNIDFGSNPPTILALKEESGKGGLKGGPGGAPGFGMLGGRGGGSGAGPMGGGPMGGPMMGGGMPGGNRGGAPGQLGNADEGKKDKRTDWVKITDLAKRTDYSLAEIIRPARMAVIAGAFPYKKQVEEFRTKLGLRADEEVLAEASAKPAANNKAQAAFRFIGVQLQRRELDGDGNPVAAKGPDGKTAGDWADQDITGNYMPYVIATGRRFEEEDPQIAAIKFGGLVMPRLKQFDPASVGTGTAAGDAAGGMAGGGMRGGDGGGPVPPMGAGMLGGMGGGAPKNAPAKKPQYPDVEKELPAIKKTLESLKDKTASDVAKPPERFGGGFDIFTGESTTPEAPPTTPTASKPQELPEYCLVRLLDVTVQPGKTYQYRMRVRMANPNAGRKDLASPLYGKEDELVSEWSKVPVTVRVEPELNYYLVDQQAAEMEKDAKTKYVGPYKNYGYADPNRMVFMQAHRWVEKLDVPGVRDVPVGEWAVAERFPVFRGEYVGLATQVEVPVWRYAREEFIIASDPNAKKGAFGINVPFKYQAGAPQPEAILVDFTPRNHGYERVTARTEEKVETKKVVDSGNQDAILMKPDGKLMFLEGAADFKDDERVKRVDSVRDRLESVRNKSKTGTSGGNNPFGGRGD